MRRVGIGAVVTLLVALAALIPIATRARAQAAPPAPNSYALRHSVVVVGPNSPLFDGLLEKWFPGASSVKYFEQMRPLLAIVHNNTERVVKAYVVKWTITNSDGSTQIASLHVIGEPPPGDPSLAGTRTILGPGGTGLGTQLVSPWFHWPKRTFPSLLETHAVTITFQAVNMEPLVSSIQRATSVGVTLDGAIFGDGVFVGQDTLKLYERFQAQQEAAVDEAKWMLGQLRGGATQDQIRDGLSRQIYDGHTAAADDFYAAALGEIASRFLTVLTEGRQAVGDFAAKLAKSSPMALRLKAGA